MASKSSIWGGRFTGGVDPLMQAFNESLSYDKRMYRADIQGSQAYIVGLTKAGVLTEDERKVRLANPLPILSRVRRSWS